MGLPQLSTTTAASTTRWIVPAVLGLAVVGLASGAYFVVPQTDVAFVKRFGKVVDPQAGPFGQIKHFGIESPTFDLLLREQ